ncbi:MAG: hypothetical protein HY323_07180 [Betaproteobacteria bacterium]|nr:hypothetical protein [Betaproteobacteria bacterium]
MRPFWRRLWLGRARNEAAGDGPILASVCVKPEFFTPETVWVVAYLPFFRAFTPAGMAMLRDTTAPGGSPAELQAQVHAQAMLLANLRAAGLLVGASPPPGMN